LPADGGKGKLPHALCEHCDAPLHEDARYALCPACGSFYLAEYGECPFCSHALPSLAASQTSEAYTTESRRRKSRDGQYFWQLYMNYQQQSQEAPTPTEEPGPQPSGNGHALGASLNGSAAGNGTDPSELPSELTPDPEANPKSKIQNPKSSVD